MKHKRPPKNRKPPNEKPFKLDMSFEEALKKLARIGKPTERK
jgi:hypothetical protein